MIAVRTPTVALVGNPNTGKSTLFNALAGMSQRVGNYPGVTVETKKGRLTPDALAIDIIDLPGTYSRAPRSPDEMLAVDVILGQNTGERRPDVVVAIVDASNLARNLYLLTQVLELGVPVVIALNMMDVARKQGLTIDVNRLSQQLGVPVTPVQANRGVGIAELKSAIAKSLACSHAVTGPAFPQAFESEVARLNRATNSQEPAYLIRRLLLDVGGYAENRLVQKYGPSLAEDVRAARARLTDAGFMIAGVEARVRYGWIRAKTAGCIERPATPPIAWTDRLDAILTHWFFG